MVRPFNLVWPCVIQVNMKCSSNTITSSQVTSIYKLKICYVKRYTVSQSNLKPRMNRGKKIYIGSISIQISIYPSQPWSPRIQILSDLYSVPSNLHLPFQIVSEPQNMLFPHPWIKHAQEEAKYYDPFILNHTLPTTIINNQCLPPFSKN